MKIHMILLTLFAFSTTACDQATLDAVLGVKKNEQEQKLTKYIRARQQSISLEIGETIKLKASFIGGTKLEEQNLIWHTDDTNAITLISSSGQEVLAQAKQVGTTVITVSHPKSQNTLKITIVVEDRQRRLNLSKKSLKMKTTDPPQEIYLNIRGGTEDDYEHLQWASSNTAVARILGNTKTVSIKPEGPGTATITVTLTTTGQKTTLHLVVLDSEYIIFPQNEIKIKKGQSQDILLEYSPSNLLITLNYDRSALTISEQSDKNGKMLSVRARTEGIFPITATARGGLKTTTTIISYIERKLIIPRDKIKIEPKNEITKTITVEPPEEIDSPDIKISINDKKIATVTKIEGTLTITGIKEGTAQLTITDNRRNPTQRGNHQRTIITIPIEVEYEDISDQIHDGLKADHTLRGIESKTRHWNRYVFQADTITIRIDSSINVHRFEWNTHARTHWSPDTNSDERHAGIKISRINHEKQSIFIEFLNDRGPNVLNDVDAFQITIHYTIYHGILGRKVHKGSFVVFCDAY